MRTSLDAKINFVDFLATQDLQNSKQDDCQTFQREQKKTSEDNQTSGVDSKDLFVLPQRIVDEAVTRTDYKTSDPSDDVPDIRSQLITRLGK